MRPAPAALLFAATVSISSAAQAEPPRDLHFTTAIDLPITLVLIGGYQLSELAFKKKLAPLAPRWTDRANDGAEALNAFDRGASALRWRDRKEAGRISDFALLMSNLSSQGFTFLAGSIARDSGAHAAENALMILEATSVAAATNQITKFLVGRQRPCAHFAPPEEKAPCSADPRDRNLSFFSGHATVTAALAVSSGTVASLRGYSLAPVVWGSGTFMALTTGYLRIAAEKHYVSDVLVGLAVGSAIGALVPLIFHGRTSPSPPSSMSQAPPLGGASFGYSGVF